MLVVLGLFADNRAVIDAIASEFGWQTVEAADPQQFEQLLHTGPVVGILIDITACGGAEWLGIACSSKIRAVLCTSAAARLREDELETLGAFDALLLPLHRDELRQSLGFLGAAARREAETRHWAA